MDARHTQTVEENEQGGNKIKCKAHIFEFIDIDLIECTECGDKRTI